MWTSHTVSAAPKILLTLVTSRLLRLVLDCMEDAYHSANTLTERVCLQNKSPAFWKVLTPVLSHNFDNITLMGNLLFLVCVAWLQNFLPLSKQLLSILREVCMMMQTMDRCSNLLATKRITRWFLYSNILQRITWIFFFPEWVCLSDCMRIRLLTNTTAFHCL